jgi:hypothetical protein
VDKLEQLVAKAIEDAATDVAAAVKADQRYAPIVNAAANMVIKSLAAAASAS